MVGRSVHKLLRTWLGLLISVLKREESACAAISLKEGASSGRNPPRFEHAFSLTTVITIAHSFPRPAEFRAKPRNLGFLEPRNLIAEFVFFPQNSSFSREIPLNLTFFIRTTIFSQKMTSK